MVMPTLLLVEDERIVALDLARRLTKLGYTVLATAGSGREALQQASALRPDLVLMDVGLPGGMDGIEAAAHIRAQAEIPIIYLTGSPEGVRLHDPETGHGSDVAPDHPACPGDRRPAGTGTLGATERCGGQDGLPLGAASGNVRGARGSGLQAMRPLARLLIVEDERVIALDLQRRVQRIGYTVVALVATGPAAIHQALEHQPDLVLMDIHLQEDMDGVEAAQCIQAQVWIPVIYLSAYVDEITAARVRATHPAGFLPKPVSDWDLQRTLNRTLGPPA